MGATAGDGQVVFRYTDSTGQLTVLATGGNLHFYDVSSGCLGLVNTGDRATLGATYTVTRNRPSPARDTKARLPAAALVRNREARVSEPPVA